MKILKKFMAAFIAAALLMTGFNYVPAEAATAPAGMKAVWISFQDIQTFLKGKDQQDNADPENLRSAIRFFLRLPVF